MPKFEVCFAYDISVYTTVQVEAETEEEARKIVFPTETHPMLDGCDLDSSAFDWDRPHSQDTYYDGSTNFRLVHTLEVK